MIFDKIIEGLLSELSRFHSGWRGGGLFIGLLVFSNAGFLFFDSSIYVASISDFGAKFISSILSVKIYEFVILVLLSYILSPLSSALIIKFFLQKEMNRAEVFFLQVSSEIEEASASQIHEKISDLKRDAASGEENILKVKGLNELLCFTVFIGLWACLTSKGYLALYLVFTLFSFLLQFFVSQQILSTYLGTIYRYRAALDRLQKLI